MPAVAGTSCCHRKNKCGAGCNAYSQRVQPPVPCDDLCVSRGAILVLLGFVPICQFVISTCYDSIHPHVVWLKQKE